LDADRVETARRPQRGAAVEPERTEGVGLGKALDGEAGEAGERGKLLDTGIAVVAGRDEKLELVLGKAVDLAEAEADGVLGHGARAPSPCRGEGWGERSS